MFGHAEIPVKIVYKLSSVGIFSSSKSEIDLIKNGQVKTYYPSEKEVCSGAFGCVRFFKNAQGEELAVKSPIGVVRDHQDFDGANVISSEVFFQKAYPNHLSSMHTWPGTYRQVMSKFPGITLDQALKKPTQIYFIDVMLAVAGELKRLHELGIVHGDIKATNIMVNGTDIYFVDFDHAYDAGKKATTTDFWHEDCQHWAPERTGRTDSIDANINQDIYSFAMLFDEKFLNRCFLENHIIFYLDLYGDQAKSEPESRPSLEMFISALDGFKKMQVEADTLDINNGVRRTM